MKNIFLILFSTLALMSFTQKVSIDKSFEITGEGSKGVLVKVENDGANEGFYKLTYFTKRIDNTFEVTLYTYDYDLNFIDVKKTIYKEPADCAEHLAIIGYSGDDRKASELMIKVEDGKNVLIKKEFTLKFDWKKYDYKRIDPTETKLKLPFKEKEYKLLQQQYSTADSSLYLYLNHKKKTQNYLILQLDKNGKIANRSEVLVIPNVLHASLSLVYKDTKENGIATSVFLKNGDLDIQFFSADLKATTKRTIKADKFNPSFTRKQIESMITKVMDRLFILNSNGGLCLQSFQKADAKNQLPSHFTTIYISKDDSLLFSKDLLTITPERNNKLNTQVRILDDTNNVYLLLHELDETQNYLSKPLAIPRLQLINSSTDDQLDPGAPDIVLEPFIPYLYQKENNKLIFFGTDRPARYFRFCKVEL